MTKRFLTSGTPCNIEQTVQKRKSFVRKQERECPEDDKYYNFAVRVEKELLKLGVKRYYAQLATLDFKQVVIHAWHERESATPTAMKLLEEKICCGYNKPMISDGPCIFAGEK